MINAIRFDRLPAFRQKYRAIDVLLVDDIQFIAGKDRTQEEFFHIFNALHDAQKQIVISSDCPPRQIPTLEERLHSRFEWGLIADIQPPDIETKVAILRKKAEAERVEIPENVALFIASKVRTNIRELEGSLIRLIAYASLTGRDIDLPLAQEVLRDLLHTEEKPITIEMIQKFVADHYNVKLTELKAKNNSKSVAVPRQIAMYLTKTLTDASPARDRQGLRRQAPLDGHPLRPQDRRPCASGTPSSTGSSTASCKHSDELARLFHVAPPPSAPRACHARSPRVHRRRGRTVGRPQSRAQAKRSRAPRACRGFRRFRSASLPP